MATVAVIIDDDFEDSEYTEPVNAFRGAGHKIVNVGLEAGKEVKGKKKGTSVTIDRTVGDAAVDDFDALLIPGGYSPDKLRAHAEPVEFVKRFVGSHKPVFAICHAAQLLVSADVLQGRKVTCYVSVAQDVKNAGAEYYDQEVVEDENLISSRNPGDLPAFNKSCLSRLSNIKSLAGQRN